jgi:transcriptional regulator with XRE-family HTH domain
MLREARERLGVGQREAARRLDIANGTLSRWESGQTVPKVDSVAGLLDMLGIIGNARDDILSLARGTIGDDWLASGQTGVSEQLAGVLDCERTARHITDWAPLCMPGMLQIREYAQAIMSAQNAISPSDAENRVVHKIARREAFKRRRDPTRLVALIGEPAIHGGIGGLEVMADQLGELLELAKLNTVAVQVVGVDGEWHPGLVGPFTLYEFDNRPPTVYLEHHRAGAFLVDESVVREYRAAIETIRRIGMSEDESRELIADQIKILEETP